MARKKSKSSASAKDGKKRGPGRPPGSGAGKKNKIKRGPGRPPGSTNKNKSKRGPGRPPLASVTKRGPGRPRKSESSQPFKIKRGPGRPPKLTSSTIQGVKRGPGRPPKAQSLQGVQISDRDLGKLLDLQSMILDVQRTHYKKSGKFDLSLSKQFSENFKTVDRIVTLLSKKKA